MGCLGRGTHRAFIACRGGAEQWEIPFGSLSYGRVLDGMTSAQVTMTDLLLSAMRGDEFERCCGIINELDPWKDELAIWRAVEATSELVWCGPVTGASWANGADGKMALTIDARDLSQWFERRLEEREREFVNIDVADIFAQIVSDALTRDPTPNIDFSSISATGVTASRKEEIAAHRRAADTLRELANTAMDYTMIGRQLIAGGTEIPTAELGRIVNEHFSSLSLSLDGLQTETETTVVGSPPTNAEGPVTAVSGGIDPQRGLVQQVVNDSSIKDPNSAQALADTRQAFLTTTPVQWSGTLDPSAPFTMADLIPGARCEARLQFLCRTVLGDHRLRTLDVTVDDANTERITATFTTAGTSGPTEPVIPSGSFTDWSYPDPGTPTDLFAITIEPEVEPDHDGWIYWAHVFGFVGDPAAGMYYGLQTHGIQPDGTDMGKVAIFSGFSTLDHVAGPGATAIHHTEGDGGDQTMLPYEWIPGHAYGFVAVQVAPPAGKTNALGEWWRTTIEDTAGGGPQVIGYIQQPAAWGLGSAFTYCFSENYGPRPVRCDLLPYCSTVFRDAYISGPRVSSSHVSHIGYAPGQCDNTRVDDIGPVAVRHLWGDGVTP